MKRMYTTLIAVILLTIGSLSLHASSFEYYPYLGEDNLYGFAEFQGGLKYDYVGSFREDLAVVMRNGKYGYIETEKYVSREEQKKHIPKQIMRPSYRQWRDRAENKLPGRDVAQ